MLKNVLYMVGWAFSIIPVLVFVVFSAKMIWGASGDDEVVRAIVLAGVAMFFIGIILLLMMYLTNIVA